MYSNPHTHMEISRARQADLVREADQRRLAKLVAKEDKYPGLASRVLGFFGQRTAKHQPVVRPA